MRGEWCNVVNDVGKYAVNSTHIRKISAPYTHQGKLFINLLVLTSKLEKFFKLTLYGHRTDTNGCLQQDWIDTAWAFE